MNDELTHSIRITITGNYPHGKKNHAEIIMDGDGDVGHMLDAFRASLMAAGFSLDTVTKLKMEE